MERKSCYGNYMLEACKGHNQCKEAGCFSETSRNHGVCDCKYKGSCHLGRQTLQVMAREESDYGYDSVEQCDFYKLIDKNHKKGEQ